MGLCGACPFLLSSCDSRPRGLDCALCRFGNFWHNLHFAPVLSGLILPYGERSGVSNHGYCPGNAACRADGFRAARRSVRRLSARTRRRCRTVQIGAKQALGPVSAGVSLRAPSTKRWIFVAPALSGSPSSPRTRPDRTGLPRFGAFRRGGRVVECTALEMRHRCKPIGVRILPLRHYTVLLSIRLFETTAKTTTSVTNAVAASSAMVPVVTAQVVVFDRGFGGRISRGGPHGWQAQAARR